jgi:hypothetical protein
MALHSHWDFASFEYPGWRVNGKRVQKPLCAFLDSLIDDNLQAWPLATCPCCNAALQTVALCPEPDEAKHWYVNGDYAIQVCHHCAFWQWRSSEGTNKCMDEPITTLAASVIKRFDPELPAECSTELACQLRRDASRWHEIAPARLERLVADIFRANYSGAEVVYVGRPGDLGVDVIFIDTSARQWLIQVKRRARPTGAEGFVTLQQLLGTLVLHGVTRGIIATTADYFTAQLMKQRNKAQSLGFTIELLDRGKLDRMLGQLLPDRPWLQLLKEEHFWAVNDDLRRYFLQKIPSRREPSLFESIESPATL